MSLVEIKEAIAKLPPEERRELALALTHEQVQLTADEKARIQSRVDAVAPGDWVSWEKLKSELS